jgi:peptidoglycan/LPS O-acetylase OafA/YrhL
MILILGYASSKMPWFAGQAFEPSVTQILLHLGYANVWFGYPWLSVVFWSLAIEFQYYLLIGLLFPLLVNPAKRVRYLTMASLSVLPLLLSHDQFLFHYLLLFLLGITTFQYRTTLLRRPVYLTVLALLTIGVVWVMGALVAAVSVSTALCIAFVKLNAKPLMFLGQISYSLYLVHTTIGGRIINMGTRFTTSLVSRYAVLAVGLAVSIGSAYLLFRFVERPAQRLSSRIKVNQSSASIKEESEGDGNIEPTAPRSVPRQYGAALAGTQTLES